MRVPYYVIIKATFTVAFLVRNFNEKTKIICINWASWCWKIYMDSHFSVRLVQNSGC